MKFRLKITVRTLNSRSILSYMDFFGSSAFKNSLPEHQKNAEIVIYMTPISGDKFVARHSNCELTKAIASRSGSDER